MKEATVTKVLVVLLIAILFADAFGAYAVIQSEPVKKNAPPSPSSSPIPTTVPTAIPTPIPTLTPTPTPTSEPTATPTTEPASTPTFEPTPSPSPIATATPTPVPTPPSPTPAPTPTATPSPTPLSNATASINWAGYVVSSDMQNPQANVTGVSASWTVPIVTASNTTSTYSAIWIGIGGQFNNDSTLIQCGTEQDSILGFHGITNADYSAWYELLPNLSTTIFNMNISPSDQMQASIQLANATSNQWVINITDTTTAQSFQSTFTYNSSQLTAEWIVERPTLGHRISDLANFENVTFTDCNATIASSSSTITNFAWQGLTMNTSTTFGGSSVQLADVSELTPDGSSFTVNWIASD